MIKPNVRRVRRNKASHHTLYIEYSVSHSAVKGCHRVRPVQKAPSILAQETRTGNGGTCQRHRLEPHWEEVHDSKIAIRDQEVADAN